MNPANRSRDQMKPASLPGLRRKAELESCQPSGGRYFNGTLGNVSPADAPRMMTQFFMWITSFLSRWAGRTRSTTTRRFAIPATSARAIEMRPICGVQSQLKVR